MAGHNKWSKIKRDKGVNDAKRGAVFTKIGNQIAIAAKSGTDPSTNAALAMAVDKAKSVNMPMANIQRAIDRAADKNAAQLEEVTYEGYGPGGTAVIVEAATDNKNRTYPDVRHAFSKNGGTIAEPGSVAFQFERRGVLTIGINDADPDELLLQVLDAGANDAVIDDDSLIVYTEMKMLHEVRSAIDTMGIKVDSAELSYVPTTSVSLESEEVSQKVIKLLEALDDLDDVNNVYSNADL